MSFITAILSLVALQALTATALPPCTCTRNLRQVCGSDGKTYANECILNCEKHNTGADLTVARDGPCDIVKDSCICTYEYKPVCGNDGQTYPNRCSLLCARSVNPDVDVVSEGACDTAKVTEVPCICPDALKQVCGTDGNTYDNSCVLNCATAKYSTLGIKHQGKCDDSVRVAEPMLGDQPNCTCPRDLKPVCGSDGTTYANKCLLECAGAQVTIARQGSC